MSDFNKLLKAIATGDKAGVVAPNTAMEKYLGRLAGTYTGPLPVPKNEMERYMLKLAERGMGVILPALTNPATAAQILAGFEAIDQNGDILPGGIIVEDATVTPSAVEQKVEPQEGSLLGYVTVEGDANLTPANIKKGISIFGVNGAMEEGSGGGAVAEVAAKEVNFYDYDGTCVYAYTLDEFAALTELPAGPEHDGLTFSGWNATLDEIKAFGGPVGIGALYTTDDSKTHLHIRLARACSFSIYSDNAGTVDWGDGSNTESLVRNDKVTHEYAAPGDYVIRLSGSAGAFYIAAAQCDYVGSEPTIFGGIPWQAVAIMEAHIAKTHSLSNGGLNYLPGLSAVSLGASVNLATQCLRGCASLKWVSLPRATQIRTNTFLDCESLVEVTIPASVTSINESAFSGCTGIQVFNLLSPTPPTLAGEDYLGTEYVTIYRVPAGCAETYMADTNWANYADYIVEGNV